MAAALPTTNGNLLAGNNRRWQHTPSKAVRVPACFADELLAIARKMDAGEYVGSASPSLENLSLPELLQLEEELADAIATAKESACDRSLEQAIAYLAERCDGAAKDDSTGFNAFDARFGHWLYGRVNSDCSLTQRQAKAALEMTGKYANTQLSAAGTLLPRWEEIAHQYPETIPTNFTEEEPAHRLELIDGKICHYSPYDQARVRRIKVIEPKRRFEGEDKSWRFPPSAAQTLVATFGDECDWIDPDVTALVIAQEREQAIAAQAKLDAAQTVGEELKTLIETAQLEQPLPCGWVLFKHQRKGVEWLLAHQRGMVYRGGILADDMGLGKTIEALVAAKLLSEAKSAAVFIVAPASLRDDWVREAQKVGVSIEVFSWAKMPKPLENQPYILVANESHYAQNAKSKRTQNLLALAESENCQATWLLTGTPMKNGQPSNLFPLLQAIAHPVAEDRYHYERHYCAGYSKSIGRGKTAWDVTGAAHLDELSEKISDALLRRTKKQCLDLPEKQRISQPAQLNNKQQKAYRTEIAQLAQEYRDRIEAAKERAKAAANAKERKRLTKAAADLEAADAIVTLNRLRKIGSQFKVESAITLVEELLEQGQQAVVFTEFVDSAKAIAAHFEGTSELLTGETATNLRQAIVDRFQNGESKVFVGTISAGGVGLTLTAASNILLVDRPWTPGDAEQAEDRCNRIGQKSAVSAHWLQLGDIDAMMDAVLESKQARIELVLKGKRKTLKGLDSASAIAKQILAAL